MIDKDVDNMHETCFYDMFLSGRVQLELGEVQLRKVLNSIAFEFCGWSVLK